MLKLSKELAMDLYPSGVRDPAFYYSSIPSCIRGGLPMRNEAKKSRARGHLLGTNVAKLPFLLR